VHERDVRRSRETPGVEIKPEPRNHNHIVYHDVRVPLDHLLGPEDGRKVLAQRRLGGGRIHHAMRTIAQCKLAFDMMCERALSRESHGKIIAEHQMVQEKIADSYAMIRMLRLLVLEAAWKIDNTSTQEARTDIATVKFTMAKVLREVSFNALHIHGSLGTTDLTPLQAMYAGAPTMGHRRRCRRGAQGDRRAQRAEAVPAARGLLPDAVLPEEARSRVGEVRAALRGRPGAAQLAEGYRSTSRTDAEPSSSRRLLSDGRTFARELLLRSFTGDSVRRGVRILPRTATVPVASPSSGRRVHRAQTVADARSEQRHVRPPSRERRRRRIELVLQPVRRRERTTSMTVPPSPRAAQRTSRVTDRRPSTRLSAAG
jgi:hypothetical protein